MCCATSDPVHVEVSGVCVLRAIVIRISLYLGTLYLGRRTMSDSAAEGFRAFDFDTNPRWQEYRAKLEVRLHPVISWGIPGLTTRILFD